MSDFSRYFPESVYSPVFPLVPIFSCKGDIIGLQFGQGGAEVN